MNYDRLLQLGGIDRQVPPIPGYISKQELKDGIDAINAKIPTEASEENQLADQQYMNEKVSTDSATFRGSHNLVSDLGLTAAATRSDIATALGTTISTADNNDYCYVEIPAADATPTEIARVERYKFNGTVWGYEYNQSVSAFADVYIGGGAAYTDAMIAANHYDNIIKGKSVSVTLSNTYLWVILPLPYSPTALMGGMVIPMTAQSSVTVNGVTYNVLKSDNTYTGTINVVLV